jgi:hypothetical protein
VPGAQQENADDGQARDEDDPRGQHDQVDSGHPRRPPTAGAVMISAPGGHAGLVKLTW